MLTFTQLKRNLKKDPGNFKKIRLAILSDAASQFIHQGIKGYGIEVGLNFEIFEADYNQIDRQVFAPDSELYEFAPEFIFINFATEHLLKKFYKTPIDQRSSFAAATASHIREISECLRSSVKSKIIINTLPEINDAVFGNFAAKTDRSFLFQLRKLNILIMELAQEFPNLFICDIASLQSTTGSAGRIDSKMYINGDLTYNLDFIPLVSANVCSIIQAINGTFRKCVILDLDNTLWGGIIGDDGMEGIQIGDLGIGKAFSEFQQWIRELNLRGIIIAVCSKNTEEIAKEPFLSHPEMILRQEDIAVFMANWETKVDNIRHIQSILNIGFDSMVFLDDNPFEREMVRSSIPDITVPELPEDPAEYLPYLRALNFFETASLTEEDIHRTRQYQQEAKRNILQKTFANESDFLASLEMTSAVAPFNKFTIPRVAQLTQRSNQFNLRTKRYTEQEVQLISESDGHFTLSFTLEDKFGEHGLIAAVILHQSDADTLFVDTWIMSCRVLKRGMEQFTLNCLVDLAIAKGCQFIVGEYLPTTKNVIVKDHYLNLGFSHNDGLWHLDVENHTFNKTFIEKK